MTGKKLNELIKQYPIEYKRGKWKNFPRVVYKMQGITKFIKAWKIKEDNYLVITAPRSLRYPFKS